MSDSFLAHAVSCSLEDLVDHLVIVQLRDGRKLIGTLISFDQYSNIVLHRCVELLVCGSLYAESPLGTHILRGESVVLMGTLSHRQMTGMQMVSVDEVKAQLAKQREASSLTQTEEHMRVREEEDFALY